MAKSNPQLIEALRETANRLSNGAKYEWGHMGRCNCGHLVQTVTEMSDVEIARSVQFELDEWTEYAQEFCDGSGEHVEDLFLTLQNMGFGYQDVIYLENLSDKRVLSRIGTERGKTAPQFLQRNNVSDVMLYMQTLADVLEEGLVEVV